jgi:N6-adenosine-specific RNA methylase IME4
MSGPYQIIYADPPWAFKAWSGDALPSRVAEPHYNTMTMQDIQTIPVADWCADDCSLFMWIVWPSLPAALEVIKAWGFEYKTCGFCWIKGDARQRDFFQESVTANMGMGYWTRANSEVCLIATRGQPKRISAAVRQAIVEPKREHSRKPDCVPERIVKLMGDLPRLEMFARTKREGWDSWGNETDKFKATA